MGAGGVLFVAGMGETRASDMAHRIVLKYYWIRGLLGLNVAGIVVTRNLVGSSFIFIVTLVSGWDIRSLKP